jgi:hypothetical protein
VAAEEELASRQEDLVDPVGEDQMAQTDRLTQAEALEADKKVLQVNPVDQVL